MEEEFSLRMRDLVRESGLPASALRYYLGQGLLPPPQRPTTNSALYGVSHLEAARGIARLKALQPRIGLAPLRRALALLRQGIEPEVALALQSSVFDREIDEAGSAPLDVRGFAAALGTTRRVIEALCADGVLLPFEVDGSWQFDGLDLRIARAALKLRGLHRDSLAIAARIAAHLRAASGLEIELRNLIVAGRSPQVAAQTSEQMQRWVNLWHGYQFTRLRVREVARFGIGTSGLEGAG